MTPPVHFRLFPAHPRSPRRTHDTRRNIRADFPHPRRSVAHSQRNALAKRRTIMKELFDELLTGAVSRRRFIERASAAGMALIASSTDGSAQGRPIDRQEQKGEQKPGEKLSPANIGGGGRVERNFYRDWIRESKTPMVEGYSIYDAKNQEVRPWPEIEGRGLYLN